MSVEINIEGNRYPVPQSPTVTKSISSLEDPKSISGLGSKRSFEVPVGKDQLTPANINIGPDVRKTQLDATVEVDGLPVAKGKAIIISHKRPNSRSGADRTTSVSFIGDNADWFSQIKDMRITDLINFGAHTLNDDVLFYGVNSVALGDDWCYTLIKRKNWKDPGYVRMHEHTPAIFLAAIFKAAFKRLGYTIDSEFFSTPFWERLIIPVPLRPYTNEYIRNNIDAYLGMTAPVTITHVIPSAVVAVDNLIVFNNESFPFYDAGDNYNDAVAGKYRVPAIEGLYDITFNCKISGATPGVTGYFVQIRRNATVLSTTVLLDSDANITITATEVPVAATTDEFSFVVQTFNNTTVFSIQVDAWAQIKYSSAEYLDGSTIELNKIIPTDWVFEDIFKDVKLMFNLLIDTNAATRTVRIEPRDPYRLRSRISQNTETTYEGFHNGSVINLDRKKVHQEEELLPINQNRKGNVKYTYGDQDNTTEFVESGQEVELLTANYNFGDDDNQEEDVQDTSFFAKAMHIHDSEVQHEDSTITPQFVMQYDNNFYDRDANNDETDFDAKPTILFFAGRRSGKDGYINLKMVNDTEIKYDYPASFQVNYNDPTGYDPSLSFANEQLDNGDIVIGLLENFHLRRLAVLRNNWKLIVSLHLTISDFLRFGFDQIYYLEGVRYTLNEITGFRLASNSVATIELIPEGIAYGEDKKRITHSPIQSLIRV